MAPDGKRARRPARSSTLPGDLAKLTRPKVSGVVSRERLFAKLDELHLRRNTFFIQGPPGAGKTTLVSSWLQARRRPCIWIQIDAGDSDIPTFFYYLFTAAQSHLGAKPTTLCLLTPEYLSDIEGFARRFFRELFSRAPKNLFIVFDNYQELPEDSPLHPFLSGAIDEIPHGKSMMIITRSEMPRAFSRQVANGNVAMLDWNDLQLDFEECTHIASKRTLTDLEIIRSLHRQSNGWTAGLILLLEQSQRTNTLAEKSDPDSLRGIFEYFAGQILDRYSTEDQKLLLISSYLPQIPERAALAVIGPRGVELLQSQHRRHLFIERRVTSDTVYQFHGLFRSFLQHRAKEIFSGSEQAAALLSAGSSLEAAGYVEDACNLYRLVGAHTQIERIALQEANVLIRQGRWRVLLEWIEVLPSSRMQENCWLPYWCAMARLAIEPAQAQLLLQKSHDIAIERRDSLCQVLTAAGMIQTYILQYALFRPLDLWINEIHEALTTGVSFPSADVEMRVQAALLIALAYRQPAHPALTRCVERVYDLSETCNDPNLRALGIAYIFAYGATTGSPTIGRRALPILEESLRHPEVTPLNRAWAYFLIAWFNCVTGSFVQSTRATQEILGISEKYGLPHVQKFCTIIGTWRELFKSDVVAAQEWIPRLDGLQVAGRPYDVATYHVTIAWYLVLNGRSKEALEHYQLGLPLFDQAGSIMHQVIYRFYAAFAASEVGQPELAYHFVDEARKVGGEGLTSWQACALHCAEAYTALLEGDTSRASEQLRIRFTKGRMLGEEHGIVHVLSPFMPRLCAFALERGIELDYVKGLVRSHSWDAPTPGIANWPWPVRIRTLGQFQVSINDNRLHFGRKTPKKPLALLKLLVVANGRISESKVIASLWTGDEEDPRAAYRAALHRLREQIGERAIIIEDGVISLNNKHCWADAWELENLISLSKDHLDAGDEATAVTLLREAGNLYQGNFLPSHDEETWVMPTRARLHRRFLQAIEALGSHLEAQKKWEEAINWYIKGLKSDELSEVFYQGLMRCYLHSGRRPEAISVFRRLRNVLSVSVGMTPSKPSLEIYSLLMRDS